MKKKAEEGSDRQSYAECGASECVEHFQAAIVGLDDLFDNRKPEARPLFSCGEEGQKDLLADFKRNTRPLIRHVDNQVLPEHTVAYLDGPAFR